jgi:hypothetical protein
VGPSRSASKAGIRCANTSAKSAFGILRRPKELGLSVQSRRIHTINRQHVEVDMRIGGRPKPLHERDGAALGLVDTRFLLDFPLRRDNL